MAGFLIGKKSFLKTNLNGANYQQKLLLLYRQLVLHRFKGLTTEKLCSCGYLQWKAGAVPLHWKRERETLESHQLRIMEKLLYCQKPVELGLPLSVSFQYLCHMWLLGKSAITSNGSSPRKASGEVVILPLAVYLEKLRETHDSKSFIYFLLMDLQSNSRE